MGDDAHDAAAARHAHERGERLLQRLAVERAEALVDEHGLELHAAGGRLHLVGQAERQRQGGGERLAAGERLDAARRAVVVVDDLQLQPGLAAVVARAGDNRSQTGLELEVIDHYNGTARSVKTLSGGETFAASLSLALGLSDEVQATAGGVQLEAMFVDEGFGSLDSEALQQALAALVGVSGGSRIVGIISHVAELKDRIDRQIIVTKDRSGGSRVQVQA